MTGTAKAEPLRPDTAIDLAPVGDRSKGLRRKIAYAFLIFYALLMFVPLMVAGGSVAVADAVMTPDSVAPAAGAVIETIGANVSGASAPFATLTV